MKYKVSDVKRILNISEDTLRYFDNKKIVNTIRDKHNNYRYFKSEDINKIFAYKMYRSLLFNMKDAEHLISGNSIDQIEFMLKEQLDYIKQEQDYFNRVQNHIELLSEKLSNWNIFKGGFELCQSPDCYYHGNQTDTNFMNENVIFDNTYKCLNSMPDIWPSYYYDRNQPNANNLFSYGYGFYSKGNPPVEGLVHIPSQKCLYTFFTLEENLKQHISNLFLEAEQFCHANGYKLQGIAHGNILHEMMENNSMVRLFDIYIPIVEDDDSISIL